MKLLQIQNQYMQPISFFRLLSNRSPEKYGFQQIKRANPRAGIHPSEFGYHPDIQNGFLDNFGQIMFASQKVCKSRLNRIFGTPLKLLRISLGIIK